MYIYNKILLQLNKLNNSSIDIEAAALVSVDGFVIAATALPVNMEIEQFSAICAGVFLLGNHTATKCRSGVLEQVLFTGTENQIIIIPTGTEAILAVIIKSRVNLERLFSSLKPFVEKMTIIMDATEFGSQPIT